MKNNIESIVDSLPGSRRESKQVKSRRKNRVKYLSILVGVILLASAVTGVLLILYDVYFLDAEYEIDTVGVEPLIFYDTLPIADEATDLPDDVTVTMVAGDVLYFTHTIESSDKTFDIVFDDSEMDLMFTDPLNLHYGFYWSVTLPDDSPLPDPFWVCAEQDAVFKYKFEVDEQFAYTETPVPFDVQLLLDSLYTYNIPPQCSDDYAEANGAGVPIDCYVLDNDFDPDEGDVMTITDVTQPPNIVITIEGVAPNQYLQVTPGACQPGSHFPVYTVTDGTDTSTAILEFFV